jgi:phenylalanyl-tRNA synthetase beta chain
MRISWKWLSEFVDLSGVKGPEQLAEVLTRRGLEVEEVRPLAKGFEKVVTVKILERAKHPDSDRLSLCKVSLGEGDPQEIVCGAQNMKAGDIVALAQIGALLPNGMKIERSKIRGVVSNGMLCSEQELGLKAESEGILILPESTRLGQPLAEVMGMDDTILVFKLTANRGDCLGHFSLAREVAAALAVQAKLPKSVQVTYPTGQSPIQILLDAGDLAPQFFGVCLDGVKIGPSPDWVKRKLEAVGSRSINNVVDATNLAMLELGYPMHAYDRDKLAGGGLGVRLARPGEELPLLDGATVTLAGSELVIFDGAAEGGRAVGLAGVMGGGNSEVSDTTTRLFLECAEFHAVTVRKSANRHARRTEAAIRFEKGIDPTGLQNALGRLVALIQELAGGQVIAATEAHQPARAPGQMQRKPILVASGYFNGFLGTSFSADEMKQALVGLGCSVQTNDSGWNVVPPSFRLDLNQPEDLAEEVARSLGYDRIPATIPPLTGMPTLRSQDAGMARWALAERAKDAWVQNGFSETVNFAFTQPAWLVQLGLKSEAKLLNPLSEELSVLVPSLLPGLIRNALDSWNHHFGAEKLPIRLFELRPTFHTQGPVEARGEMETSLIERWKLAVALSGPRQAQALRGELGEVDFFDLKAAFESTFDALGARGVRFLPLSQSRSGGNPLLHPGQSVEVLAGNQVAGSFGLLHPKLARILKVRAPLYLGELDWEVLQKLCRPVSEGRPFKAISQFPGIERDFALVVKSDIPAEKVTQIALKAGRPLAKSAQVFDIYRGSQVAEGMTSVAVRVTFLEEGRSPQEAEAENSAKAILDAWKKELGAELR